MLGQHLWEREDTALWTTQPDLEQVAHFGNVWGSLGIAETTIREDSMRKLVKISGAKPTVAQEFPSSREKLQLQAAQWVPRGCKKI